MAGHGTLLEVRYKWTFDDLLDSHEVLDLEYALQRHMMEKNRHESRK